ncbi:hypothetical protein [Rhodococcus qingshengii]|uniref:hypothetical protein n=1 Tax=Rhodococcus qingshengii TaxID=334542 RepID=UPI0035FE7EAA
MSIAQDLTNTPVAIPRPSITAPFTHIDTFGKAVTAPGGFGPRLRACRTAACPLCPTNLSTISNGPPDSKFAYRPQPKRCTTVIDHLASKGIGATRRTARSGDQDLVLKNLRKGQPMTDPLNRAMPQTVAATPSLTAVPAACSSIFEPVRGNARVEFPAIAGILAAGGSGAGTAVGTRGSVRAARLSPRRSLN